MYYILRVHSCSISYVLHKEKETQKECDHNFIDFILTNRNGFIFIKILYDCMHTNFYR